jgi:hypothetical protein
MVNRKAQTQWEITGWVLAILVLAAVGMIVWYFMDTSETITDEMIQQAQVISSVCGGLASEATLQSYCTQLREIKKNEWYVTCNSLVSETKDKEFGIIPWDDATLMSGNTRCGKSEVVEVLGTIAKAKCKEIGKDTAFVAGKVCSEWNPVSPPPSNNPSCISQM